MFNVQQTTSELNRLNLENSGECAIMLEHIFICEECCNKCSFKQSQFVAWKRVECAPLASGFSVLWRLLIACELTRTK